MVQILISSLVKYLYGRDSDSYTKATSLSRFSANKIRQLQKGGNIMKDVGNIFEKLKFAVDYLQETDYELWGSLSAYILNGTGEPEVLLEAAARISFNKSMSSSAMMLVELYEEEMIRNKRYCYPFVVQSVRELITRNMITRETNSSNKCLYAIKMSNGTVKIGIATDANRRFSQIKASSGMDIEDFIYTEIFQNAFKEETRLHRKFKEQRERGEYFSISFELAREEIESIAKKKKIQTAGAEGRNACR